MLIRQLIFFTIPKEADLAAELKVLFSAKRESSSVQDIFA